MRLLLIIIIIYLIMQNPAMKAKFESFLNNFMRSINSATHDIKDSAENAINGGGSAASSIVGGSDSSKEK